MKLYFAGMESITNSYDDYTFEDTDNVFGTYFYEGNTTKMLLKLRHHGKHKGIITVDSGAHSFFGFAGVSSATHHKSSKKEDMPDPNEYIMQYLAWLKKYGHLLDYFVELDIQAIVGIEKVRYWRKKLEREGLWHKCIPVLHSCDTEAQWDETIKGAASGYVGLEGLRAGKVTLPYMKLLEKCYNLGVKVHGFALTNYKILEQFPFWSADSTTWTSCVRYGTFIVRDEFGKMMQKNPSTENYLSHGISLDIHKNKRSKESSTKKLEHSAQKFRESEKFLTRLWVERGVDWDKKLGGSGSLQDGDGRLELQEGPGRPRRGRAHGETEREHQA